MKLSVSARRTTSALLTIVVALQLANAAGQVSRHVLGHGALLGLVDLFYVDREGNVPSWYSSLALLLCACLLGLIARDEHERGGGHTRRWTGLAAIFVLLALDEAVSLHELTISPLRTALGATGLLYWSWIVVGAAFALAVLVAYVPLLRALPRQTAVRFVAAGAVFVGGAIGMEALGGPHMEQHGTTTPLAAVFVTAEETLEMLGVVLFARALLLHLGGRSTKVELTFVAGGTTDQGATLVASPAAEPAEAPLRRAA